MKEARVNNEAVVADLADDARSPLAEIEADIRALMKRCGVLAGEMEQFKAESDSNTRRMLLNFVEVADAFDNVFKNISPKLDSADQQSRVWVNNFRTIHKMLLRALTTWGVTPIETVIGVKANPHWHNVTEVVAQPDREGETVVEEIKKGYLWNGALLRAAEVRAVKND